MSERRGRGRIRLPVGQRAQRGARSQDTGIMTWAEGRCFNNWATQAPQCRSVLSWWNPSSSLLLLFPLPLEMYLARSWCSRGWKGCCLCSPLGFWWIPVSHWGLSSILIYLCVWCKRMVEFHSSVYSHPIFPAPFIEEIVFFPVDIFFLLEKRQSLQ